MPHPTKLCERLFEFLNHFSANESRRSQNAAEYRNELLFQLHMRCGQIQEGNLGVRIHQATLSSAMVVNRSTLAGFPVTMALSGTSCVTTAPAPTMAFSPMTTLERMVAADPMEAPFLTKVGSTFQSPSV